MALTRERIATVRAGAGEIKTIATNISKVGEELKNILTKNGYYQYFRMGTDKGTAVDTDINVATTEMVDNLGPAVNAAAEAIESFCARQEELNRILELKKKQEEEAALRDMPATTLGHPAHQTQLGGED